MVAVVREEVEKEAYVVEEPVVVESIEEEGEDSDDPPGLGVGPS